MMQRIKIHSENDDTLVPTMVYVGDTKVENVSNIRLELGVSTVPTCEIECYGLPDNIDTVADVTITDISDDRLLEILRDKLTYHSIENVKFCRKLLELMHEVNIDEN